MWLNGETSFWIFGGRIQETMTQILRLQIHELGRLVRSVIIFFRFPKQLETQFEAIEEAFISSKSLASMLVVKEAWSRWLAPQNDNLKLSKRIPEQTG